MSFNLVDRARKLVLDQEVMGWHRVTGCVVRKGLGFRKVFGFWCRVIGSGMV